MPKPEPRKLEPDEVRDLAIKVVNSPRNFPILATLDNSQPRARPVSPVKVDGFAVYVANLRSYAKTAQIAANPEVELCYMDAEHNQVRITGLAEVVEDRQLLEEIWKSNKLLETYLGTPDNPELIVYRIKPHHVRYMQEWALEYYDVAI